MVRARRALALGAATIGALALPAGALAAGPHFSLLVLPPVLPPTCDENCEIVVADISAHGEVMGFADGAGQSKIWSWTSARGVRTVAASPQGELAFPAAVADNGDVTGTISTSTGGEHAFVVHNGVLTDLATLPGGSRSNGVAVNSRGQVAVNRVLPSGLTHAALWTRQRGFRDLGTLGGTFSAATAINRFGEVVGSSSPAMGQPRAFAWRDGKMINLRALGGHVSSALAVNSSGVVVGSSLTRSREEHAVMWTPDGHITDLGPGEAEDIDDAGDILMNGGLLKDGRFYDLSAESRRIVHFGGAVARALSDRLQIVGGECFGCTRPAVLMPVTPIDDRRSQVTYAGSWTRSPMPGAWRGTTTHTIAAGASATVHFRGRRVWWIASKRPDSGNAQVFVDGTLAATVSLRLPNVFPRNVVFQRTFARAGPHTVRIVALGTPGHPRVDIDAFSVSQL